MTFLSDRAVYFLSKLKEEGRITKKSFPTIGLARYYMITWNLRDRGLIKVNGVEKDNKKSWILTEKGKRVSDLLDELWGLLNES